MKLEKITKNEFKKFADKHEQITFHQTEEWANLKKKNAWDSHYIGLKDKNKLIAGSLILSKNIPIINKKIFYAPRGFLIDYKDKEILETFTKELKKYIKQEKGIFVKIDPYVEYIEHNNNGEIVENGLNNKEEETQKEIAKRLNISRSYVSRLEKRATTKILREFIKNSKK